MKTPDNILVMASDPSPNWNPEDVKEWYYQHLNEAGLAFAFAVASNKFWWVEDTVYDYEEGTPEYQEACRIVDAWCDLMDSLKNDIFKILLAKGITIPDKGQINALIPLMERNGFYDGNGWWVTRIIE